MYKNHFEQTENYKFNIIENENVRSGCMSVYSYMLTLNKNENEKYERAGLKKDTTTLNISFRKLLKNYNRSHNKIGLTTLKNRIDKLIELGLLIAEKHKNSFIYSFFRYAEDKVVDKVVNILKPIETIENTNVEADNENHKYLNIKTNNIDIDTKYISTVETEQKEFDSTSYKKVDSWSDISEMLNDGFKNFGIRSKALKNEIIRRIEKSLNGITLAFANNYIEKVILQVKMQENRRREAYKHAIASNFNSRNNSTWNYDGQRQYDYDALEKALLGW